MIIVESLNNIGVSVSNLDKSISFYKDLFDFDLVDKTTDTAIMRMGELIMCLYEVAGFKAVENSKTRVSFSVDEEDFEDALDEIEETQIVVAFGPENIRNGQSIVILDPDDNQIELSYPKMN